MFSKVGWKQIEWSWNNFVVRQCDTDFTTIISVDQKRLFVFAGQKEDRLKTHKLYIKILVFLSLSQ